MTRLFGTDGVRGLANEVLTAPLALKLGAAAAMVLTENRGSGKRRPTAIIGRDPRVSGEMLAAAMAAGMASKGVNVLRVGVIPTPGLAFLTDDYGADIGVMISASHNPMPDNGIKFLARGGEKLTDAQEDEIIRHLEGVTPRRPQGADVGRVRVFADAEDRYVLHLLQTLPHRLDGLKVVLDCAHGAAAGCSPEAFRAAGAEVVVIGASPDGLNINDGYGSTHLEKLQAAVREHGADLGIAHDGDADRCLAVDERGEVVDGDQIMGVMAVALKDRGVLRDDTLVVTVMSNLGLKLAMGREGVQLVETQVGDRYVLAGMKLGDYSLGGEQSGHVIFSDHATTGDGVLTGLQLASRVAETGTPLSELAAVMDRLPQVLVNVRGVDKSRAAEDEAVQAAVAEAEARLGETGRVLLRPSGTEPVVRVMVEAPDEETAGREAQVLADVVQRELRLHD